MVSLIRPLNELLFSDGLTLAVIGRQFLDYINSLKTVKNTNNFF